MRQKNRNGGTRTCQVLFSFSIDRLSNLVNVNKINFALNKYFELINIFFFGL
jgi:hypothetical protein